MLLHCNSPSIKENLTQDLKNSGHGFFDALCMALPLIVKMGDDHLSPHVCAAAAWCDELSTGRARMVEWAVH
jgi:hypothetical protein